MIKVSEVSYHYKDQRRLFHNLSFQVTKGEVLAILGPNGAGKTTLIKCLMKFLRFREGAVSVYGTPVQQIPRKTFWQYVGYVPRARMETFGFSVLETVVMGLSPYIGLGRLPKKAEYEKAEKILEELDIQHLRDRSCNKISGGQLQMVLIARTLVKKPKILIMDEPESGLDLKNQMKILQIIERLNQQKDMEIIINTHFPHHALRVADKTLIIGDGVHLYGPTKRMINKENLSRLFGVDAEILDHKKNDRVYSTILSIGLSPALAQGRCR